MKEEKELEEELFKLSEKYCQHDDRKYNSCLYYIFGDFIKKNYTPRSKLLEIELESLQKIDNTVANAYKIKNVNGFEDHDYIDTCVVFKAIQREQQLIREKLKKL